MNEHIRHNGIIERIEGDNIFVRIEQQSACAGCHARGICSASESKVKTIEVSKPSGTFHVNEEVTVCGQTALGLQAVWLAFVLPLLLVVAVVAVAIRLGWGEGLSALAGLVFLLPYYGVLYLMRNKLKKRFVFTIQKQNV